VTKRHVTLMAGARLVGIAAAVDACSGESQSRNRPALRTEGYRTIRRSYDAVEYTDRSYPATVSDFRLDKYGDRGAVL
jgi:hypothetical protein